MKKIDLLNMVKAYTDNTNSNNYNVSDCGRNGKTFEMAVKVAIKNYQFSGIAKQGKTDTRKKLDGILNSIEIKSGCGELAIIDKNGEIVTTCLNSDLIVYSPDYDPKSEAEYQSYVLNTNDFMEILQDLNLIRYKKSSAMCHQPKEQQYNDRMSIQSFSNSRKKSDAFYDSLEEKGQSLKEWIAENIG